MQDKIVLNTKTKFDVTIPKQFKDINELIKKVDTEMN